MLGFKAVDLANEGTFVLCVEKVDEIRALEVLQKTHSTSAVISSVVTQFYLGTKRFLDLPTGELL